MGVGLQIGLTTGLTVMGFTTGGGGVTDGARRAAWSGAESVSIARRIKADFFLFTPEHHAGRSRTQLKAFFDSAKFASLV